MCRLEDRKGVKGLAHDSAGRCKTWTLATFHVFPRGKKAEGITLTTTHIHAYITRVAAVVEH